MLEDPFRAFHDLTSLELPAHFCCLLLEPSIFLCQKRLGDRTTHLLSHERKKSDFVRGVRVRIAVMHVDHSDYVSASYQRDRKESFVRVFNQSLEALEAGIGRGVGGESHHRMMLD